jgi:hypothetical protein
MSRFAGKVKLPLLGRGLGRGLVHVEPGKTCPAFFPPSGKNAELLGCYEFHHKLRTLSLAFPTGTGNAKQEWKFVDRTVLPKVDWRTG